MKERLIIVVLIFSLTINAASLVTMGYFWGKNYARRDAAPEAVPPAFSRELALDPAQRDQMRELRQSFMNETSPVRDDLMIKRTELADLLTSGGVERAAMEQKIQEINMLQLTMQMAVIDQMFREKAFLNPEQQTRYADFISHRLCRDFLPGGDHHRHKGKRDGFQGGRGGRMGERKCIGTK